MLIVLEGVYAAEGWLCVCLRRNKRQLLIEDTQNCGLAIEERNVRALLVSSF